MTPSEYDDFSFITIGYDCSPAAVLRSLDLRKAALPFDWVVTNLNILDQCFQTKFSKYHTNLRFNPQRTRIIDEYGFIFPHDYPLENQTIVNNDDIGEGIYGEEKGKQITPDWEKYYPQVQEKYQRRIERFLDIVQTSEKPIIILSRFPAEQVNIIFDIFYRNYRRKDIYIVNSCQIESIGQKYVNCFTEHNGEWNEAAIWKANIDLMIEKYKGNSKNSKKVDMNELIECVESKKPIGLLENTLFINLAHRTDRLAHVLEQLKGIGIEEPERFKGIQMGMGCVGCTMSHIKCLELAKARDWPYVFICEDDIKFTNPELFLDTLAQFQGAGWSWDVLIVGGNNIPPFQQVSDFAVRVFDIQTTTGYIVGAHYYNTLIANFKEGVGHLIREPERKKEFAVDIYWKSLQKTGNWFFLIPPSVVQYSDYSDIEGKVTNFEGHMLDLDKRALIEYMMRLQQQQQQQKNPIFSMNLT
jgi:hypothetical protein